MNESSSETQCSVIFRCTALLQTILWEWGEHFICCSFLFDLSLINLFKGGHIIHFLLFFFPKIKFLLQIKLDTFFSMPKQSFFIPDLNLKMKCFCLFSINSLGEDVFWMLKDYFDSTMNFKRSRKYDLFKNLRALWQYHSNKDVFISSMYQCNVM